MVCDVPTYMRPKLDVTTTSHAWWVVKKRQKNVNLGGEKSQATVKKSQKCKFGDKMSQTSEK